MPRTSENRRNYYRILHVQRDAPPAIIKNSYRTLMQRLKMHPDLGGDHWNAAVINEAYAVLSDPKKRAEYDASLGRALRELRGQRAARPKYGAVARADAGAKPPKDASRIRPDPVARTSNPAATGLYSAMRAPDRRDEQTGTFISIKV